MTCEESGGGNSYQTGHCGEEGTDLLHGLFAFDSGLRFGRQFQAGAEQKQDTQANSRKTWPSCQHGTGSGTIICVILSSGGS